MIPREMRPNYIMAVETGSQRQEINLAISLANIPSVIVILSAAKGLAARFFASLRMTSLQRLFFDRR
jgi:hypothetical protein